MVKLRLTRTGRKNHATYRIIAIDSRKARDSKALDYLGHYLPHTKELVVDADKANKWLSVGAQPTHTVARLLVKAGVIKKSGLESKKYSKEAGEKSKERAEAKAEKAAAAKEAKKAPKEEAKEDADVTEAEADADASSEE